MLLATLLVGSFVIFGALYLAPGNPVAALSGGQPLPPGSVHLLEARYHLNEPFVAQYWQLKNVALTRREWREDLGGFLISGVAAWREHLRELLSIP
jgi:ABC-type dipeptide/oligopeptide/nickel transport system permease component